MSTVIIENPAVAEDGIVVSTQAAEKLSFRLYDKETNNMSKPVTLRRLIEVSDIIEIELTDVEHIDFNIGGDPECSGFRMADESRIFFDPEQTVELKEDGTADITVTHAGSSEREQVSARFKVISVMTPEMLADRLGLPVDLYGAGAVNSIQS